MHRICFLAYRLSGGVGRSTVTLIRHLDREQFHTTLILVTAAGDRLVDVPDDVTVVDLGGDHVRHTLFGLVRELRRRRPDLLVSIQGHVSLAALLARKLASVPAKTIVSVRTTPSMAIKAHHGLKNRVLIPVLTRVLLAKADCVVANSNGAAADTSRMTSLSRDDIKVIYNPVEEDRIVALSREPVHHPWFSRGIPVIVAVGRLSQEKGFSYLVNAVANLLPDRAVKLIIVGSGDQRDELEALVHRLGVAQAVDFVGYQDNPHKYVARADVFVLSSLWEGLPNVVIEAMVCGTPVVATDCPSGPREIITSQREGILVPPADTDALAQAIVTVLSDPHRQAEMQLAGRRRARDFRGDKIAREYEELFLRVLQTD